MRKFLDISNLVTYQSGKYQGKYDWSNNIGKELYFEYDDISGYIKIIDYNLTNNSHKTYLCVYLPTVEIYTDWDEIKNFKCKTLFNTELKNQV